MTNASQTASSAELDDLLEGSPPMTARSVVATALLGTRPPRLPVAQLVQAGSLFGIGHGAIRTALWRMVSDGELAAKEGSYELSGGLLERQRRVDDSYAAKRRPWDGTWELAVVAAERRPAAERQGLRSAATALHLAEIREGLWARPDNLDPRRLPRQQAVLDEQCLRFFNATAPAGLEGRLFDVDLWAHRARALLDQMELMSSAEALRTSQQLALGFRLSIAVVRRLQADPLLPLELLEDDWPGDLLRDGYRSFDRTFKRALARALLKSDSS